MAKSCLCMTLSQGVKVVALTCIICGVGVGAISSWVLHKALQMQKNPTLKTANDLLHQVNTFFAGTTGLYDLDVIFRILISCSATAMGAGFLQFLMSFWLLLASEQKGKGMAKAWVMIQIWIMLAIGGGFLCIITNELEINTAIFVFLIVTGIDFLLLIYFIWVVSSFAKEEMDDDSV